MTIGLLAVLSLLPAASAAQPAWPTRPIEIVVPFAAGGSVDITFRLIGTELDAHIRKESALWAGVVRNLDLGLP